MSLISVLVYWGPCLSFRPLSDFHVVEISQTESDDVQILLDFSFIVKLISEYDHVSVFDLKFGIFLLLYECCARLPDRVGHPSLHRSDVRHGQALVWVVTISLLHKVAVFQFYVAGLSLIVILVYPP